MNDLRVRFAPSPTGTLHIGGARTALFNWLYARGQGGKFILRLEDTDISRSTESSAQGIIEGLRWLGLEWDEGPDIGGPFGPYRQSERLSIYQRYLQQLLNEGKAYYCFCSPEELAAKKANNEGYDGNCRSLTPEKVAIKLENGQRPVIRFKVPLEGTTIVNDLVRGKVSFENCLMDDFIIAKSDAWPTYNFAVVVDDFTMKISHVIRAEEHLSNTPKQLLIYQALGFTVPQFAHVSMILAPDRSKLSKRHGATSVQEFRDTGYLPETMINYLALLGWSPGEDVGFLTLQDLIKRFDLSNVSKSAAVYDTEKLTWMNGHYLAEADLSRIVSLLEPEAKQRQWLRDENGDYFQQVVALVQNRAKTVTEIFDAIEYFFEDIETYDEKGVNKHFRKINAVQHLVYLADIIKNTDPFNAAMLEDAVRNSAEAIGIKAADLIHPARLALSGRTNTPGIFELMVLLGRNTCLERLQQAVQYIQAMDKQESASCI